MESLTSLKKYHRAVVAQLLLFVAIPISFAFAGTNVGISYQGRIVRPSGEAVNAGVVAFSLRIFDPNNNCLLWSEVQNLNMANSGGAFSLVVGSGTRTDGGSHTLKQVFTNAGTLTGLTCSSGTDYTPTTNEDRNLVVTFNDGGTVVALNPMSIKSAPFAMQADQVSGYGILNLAKISGAGSATTLSPFQFDFLAALAAPASASSTPCATNEILKYNGTTWACAADATGGTPSDASYGAKGVLQFDTDAATSGISIASGVATVNTGIAANQIPKFDASANLGVGIAPTSKLDVNGAITQRGMAAPAVAAAGTGRIYYDSTNNHFYFSENGGAYTQLSSATGALSSVSSISNSGGNITMAPTASTGSVLINSGTASVGTASGALVVTGGIGASGSIYTGSSINAGTTMTAATSLTTPQIYGSSSASGTLSLDGTSNATKGYVLLNSSGGNVGIGTTTPWKNLSIDATGANAGPIVALRNSGGGAGGYPGFDANVYGGAGSPRIRLGQSGGTFASPTATTLGMILGNIHFGGQGPSVATPYAASITSYAEATFTDTSSPAYIILSTTPSGSITQQERMRIDSSGNVGIGTASPGYKLQVDSANTAIYGSTTSAVSLDAGVRGNASSFGAGVYGSSTNGYGVVGVAVSSGSSSPAVLGQSYGTGPGVQGTSSLGSSGYFQSQSATNTVSTLVTQQMSTSTADVFQAQNAAGTSMVKITSDGKVGVGTTAPTATLDVNGTTNLSQAYFENLGALGTLACGATNITGFSTNIYTVTACASGTTTLNIPTVTGWPTGAKVWNVSFFVTGQTASVFNVTYNSATTSVYWDRNSTGGFGGNNYSGITVASGSTYLISCVVVNSGTVKTYCGIGAQY